MCISSELVGLQTNGALAQTMALDTLYGLGPDRWEGYAARIEAVTAGDVLAVAKRVLDLNRSVVVVTTPEAE
jgi:predicted Zn-dependent peptidase